MAISVNTAWEVRTTGAATNGGGFKDLNPGTSVDYSQQNGAQLSLTDIASNGAGTGISSATGGFTAAMVGNCMYITGTGFTTGWYQITGYTDTNNITIDRSCGASQTGGTGNVGGAWLPNSTDFNLFFGTVNKSNYNEIYIEAGTYSSLGTVTLSIVAGYQRLIGYNTTRGDDPTGTNRPLFSFGNSGANLSITGSYSWVTNLRFDNQNSVLPTTTFSTSGSATVLRNCKITRSNYTGVATACWFSGSYQKAFECEFECTNGNAIRTSNSMCLIQHCWMHDSVRGVYLTSSPFSLTVDHCIVSNCSTSGLELSYNGKVSNCIIYDCGTGVTFTTQVYCSIINTIIQDCTTGLIASEHCYNDNNILYNNATQYSGGVVAGNNSLTSNPNLTDPVNDDFTLGTSSPAFNAGIKIGTHVGLP
jgi:hypothetical protein